MSRESGSPISTPSQPTDTGSGATYPTGESDPQTTSFAPQSGSYPPHPEQPWQRSQSYQEQQPYQREQHWQQGQPAPEQQPYQQGPSWQQGPSAPGQQAYEHESWQGQSQPYQQERWEQSAQGQQQHWQGQPYQQEPSWQQGQPFAQEHQYAQGQPYSQGSQTGGYPPYSGRPGQPYPYQGGQYPQGDYGAPRQSGTQVLSILGFVCAALALFFCPILFGPAGIALGLVGRNKGESLGKWAAIAATVGLILGLIFAFFVWGSVIENDYYNDDNNTY
ncbi:hypothetical protein ACWDYH_02115 [Nocardia goodfellowii]